MFYQILVDQRWSYQAGLFSAVTSAFIILVDSQLKPDSGDDTAALLRVLIYKIDNTTFGSDVPPLPQWTGPPPAMVDVQAILFASLSASLLSAFLAMLGKQWLNRYASTDMRGSAVERGQSRQRKLDGIITWYFDSVMESLPVMLQVALLLLGCALSRYLWEISMTIASVVLGVTSFGLLFYLFILVVGTAWESCPYQTPGSHFLRYLGPGASRLVCSAVLVVGGIPKTSMLLSSISLAWYLAEFSSCHKIMRSLLGIVVMAITGFFSDVLLFGVAVAGMLFALSFRTYYLLRRVYTWLRSSPPGFDQQMAALDLRCILWTLQTSLDRLVRLSTLKHLITITELTDFDPNLVEGCFNLFIGFISISNRKVVVMQGLEEFVALSAGCFYQTFRHLSATHPTSSVLADLRQRYGQILPVETDFRGLPFYHTMANLHALVTAQWNPRNVEWISYRPSNQELIPFAQHLVEVSQVEYQRIEGRKVPRWILRFALHFLSLNPPPPSSVIADSLTIIAIALDLEPSSVLILDERYIC